MGLTSVTPGGGVGGVTVTPGPRWWWGGIGGTGHVQPRKCRILQNWACPALRLPDAAGPGHVQPCDWRMLRDWARPVLQLVDSAGPETSSRWLIND